jgi:hypothetical protein
MLCVMDVQLNSPLNHLLAVVDPYTQPCPSASVGRSVMSRRRSALRQTPLALGFGKFVLAIFVERYASAAVEVG